MMHRIILLCLVLIISSCDGNKKPSDVIPSEKMKVVLWDFICADLYAAEIKAKDSSKDINTLRTELQERAFKKNKTDRVTFNNSFNWYETNSETLKPMLDSMISVRSREMEKHRLQMLKIIKVNE